MPMRSKAMIVALALAAGSCGITGPSDSLTGTWEANYGGKFGFLGIVLQQNGDQISGTACGSSSGLLLFRNVPVRGEYPRVLFDVSVGYTEPCCAQVAGSHFSGRRDSTGDIVGQFNGTDVRFRRTSNPICR
jgi:hypothetical protein